MTRESIEIETAKAIASGLPDPAAVLDAALCVLYVNAAYLTFAGVKAKPTHKAIGEKSFQLIGRAGGIDKQDAQQVLEDGVPRTLSDVSIVSSTDELITTISFVPFKGPDDRTAGLLQIFRDNTAEALLQKRYRRLLGSERTRADEAEKRVEVSSRELGQALEKVTRLSRVDLLTGLLNRSAFLDIARETLTYAAQRHSESAVLLADIDQFRFVNDCFGHEVSDAVLASFSIVIRKALRSTDVLGRFSGEEFAILLTETDPTSARDTAQRLVRLVHNMSLEKIVPAKGFRLSISVGGSMGGHEKPSLATMVQRAEDALYRSKVLGRNRAVVYREASGAPCGIEGRSAHDVLIVEPQVDAALSLGAPLSMTCRPITVSTVDGATALLRQDSFAAVVVDSQIGLPQAATLVREALSQSQDTAVVVVLDAAAEGRPPESHEQLPNPMQVTYVERSAAHKELSILSRRLSRAALGGDNAIYKPDDLDGLLAEGRMRFVYQPMIDAAGSHIFAYEALLRDGDSVSAPVALLRAAEASDRMWSLGRQVRALAIKPLDWLPPEVILFLHMHPQELDDPTLIDETLRRRNLASRIVFELTDRSAASGAHELGRKMEHLVARGYRFAVGNLGEGYPELTTLSALEVSFVRLDMGVIRASATDPANAEVGKRLIEYAAEVGISIIAWGIETAEDVELAKQFGAHHLQGFFLGSPAPLISSDMSAE